MLSPACIRKSASPVRGLHATPEPMDELDEGFKRRIAAMEDHKLLEMVDADPADYLPGAHAFACAERERRLREQAAQPVIRVTESTPPGGKAERTGRAWIVNGYIFAGLALMTSFTMWTMPHARDPAIQALFSRPSLFALVSSCVTLLVSNLLNLPALALGLVIWKRFHDRRGQNVLFFAILAVLISSTAALRPSNVEPEPRPIDHETLMRIMREEGVIID